MTLSYSKHAVTQSALKPFHAINMTLRYYIIMTFFSVVCLTNSYGQSKIYKGSTITQKPKNGIYTYSLAFAEWNGNSLGATCTVIIKGDSIKVVHNGKSKLTGKKGDILDEGIIMKHRKTGKWIIGHSIKDKNAKEIGGCFDGPSEIDFKRKRFWSC